MRKFLSILLLFCAGGISYAQNTATLSGTLTDSASVTWTYAYWTAQLRGYYGAASYMDGTPVATLVTGSLSSAGVFSGYLGINTQIAQPGTGWEITVCPVASVTTCVKVSQQARLTTNTFNMGAFVSALVSPLTITSSPGAFGYAVSEIAPWNGTTFGTGPRPGQIFYSVTSDAPCFWSVVQSLCAAFATGSSFNGGTVTNPITAPGFSGPLTGNVTGNVTGHSSLDLPLTGGTLTGSLTLSGSATSTALQAATLQNVRNSTGFNVKEFGALCNWNGSTGTDDTTAFQAAEVAAFNLASTTGSIVNVIVPFGCVVSSTIIAGSGVEFVGPGSIIVPSPQTSSTIEFIDTNNSGVDNITFNIQGAASGSNNSTLNAVMWTSQSADSNANYSNFWVRNCRVIGNSNWGILVQFNAGTGLLTNVDISGNYVASPATYTNFDGIHVNGAVTAIRITNNGVYNRGDAGIALGSNGNTLVLSGAVVSNNTVINSLVGLDNSGADNAVWSNNYVLDTVAGPSGVNPAARAIFYISRPSHHVKFVNNFLSQLSSGGFDMQVDSGGSTDQLDIDVNGNTFGATGLYIGGSGVSVRDNTFPTGDTINVVANPASAGGASNDFIHNNRWLGNGTFNAASNASFYGTNFIDKQSVVGTLTNSLTSPISFLATYPIELTVTTTAATVDNWSAVFEATTPSACGVSALNQTAAAAIASTYISTLAAGGGILAHPATAGMVFKISCSNFQYQ